MKLANKTVLVTGGSNGIGEAIVIRFRKEGARVIIFDLKKPSFKVEFFKVDIRDEKQIQEFDGLTGYKLFDVFQ